MPQLSLLNKGFLPGDTLVERIGLLADPAKLRELMTAIPGRINAFFSRAVSAVRARFSRARWRTRRSPSSASTAAPFDFVGLDLYRTIETADRYQEAVRTLVSQGKPVVITEFGTATYRGAGDKGARAGEIVTWDATITPVRLNGVYERDETEQVRYLREP